MIKNRLILIVILFMLFLLPKSLANITISLKINDHIITNQDIVKESFYLKALNKELENLNSKKIHKIAKESIIKETIKKIELSKYYILDQKNPILDNIIKDFYLKLDMKNEIEFQNHLKKYNLTILDVKKKIEIESSWNALIEKNYRPLIQINKDNIMNKISKFNNNEKKKSYLLSEIFFEKKVNENIDDLNSKIKESIKEIGFENTANIYSISDTSKFGGKIGWIEEANLPSTLKSAISKLDINEYTDPISVNNNFLILKLVDIKDEVIELDKELLLQNMVNYELNRQLNNYSKIYYNKVYINSTVYEY